MIRIAKGEKKRIWYQAKRLTSGLTDAKVDIYTEDGSKVVTSQVMTELGSTGHYYYDWIPASPKNYYAIIDSATQPLVETKDIIVFSKSSKYGQILRSHGGATYVRAAKTPFMWTRQEVDQFLKDFDTLKLLLSNRLTEIKDESNQIKEELSDKNKNHTENDLKTVEILGDMSNLLQNYLNKADIIKNNITSINKVIEKLSKVPKKDKEIVKLQEDINNIKLGLLELAQVFVKTLDDDKIDKLSDKNDGKIAIKGI